MAVVESVQRAKIPVVDQQAGGGVGGDIVLDLRKGYRGGEVPAVMKILILQFL